jgi:DNA-binding XRE family transcriptional regulator
MLRNRAEIGQILADARAKKGWTQQNIASIIGVRDTTIEKIESGKIDVRTSVLINYCSAVGAELKIITG